MRFQDPPPRHVAMADASAALESVVETTRHLPDAEQFEFWRSCNGTLAEYDRPQASDGPGFAADARTWRFGRFALMTATTPPSRFRRMPAQIRRDGIDHWFIAVATQGKRVVRIGDAVGVLRPGSVFVGSFDQPMESQRTQSGWVMLFVPRDAVPEIGEAIDAVRMRSLATPMALILHDYLATLAGRMPQLRAEDACWLAAGTRAMLAAVLVPSADRKAEAATSIQHVLLARIRKAVRENLHLATLGPDRLCDMVSVSRSTLYRICEPFGGAASLIQAERLRAAQRALGDPAETRSIARIATDVGIFDPSTFSRLMRRRFGCTPGEMRAAALAAEDAPSRLVRAADRQPGNLRALLAGLAA